jgi:poly(A) polymerase
LIDNNKISKFAISVVQDLQKNNFQAYLVGGCVRDALTGLEPKDFDIATNATPEQIRKTFKASRIIGKRFKLVHVFNRSELLEVATFRSGSDQKMVKILLLIQQERFLEIIIGALLNKTVIEEILL